MPGGIINLNFQNIEADKVIDLAVAPMRHQITQKQIKLAIELEAGLPPVNIDLEKLAWVLVNFLANALRYTPKWGQVKIKVKRDNDMVVFSVTDSGAGIKPADLANVFKSIVDEESPGIGLALSISREIIEAHGGRIWAESKIGEGSTFLFSIPG